MRVSCTKLLVRCLVVIVAWTLGCDETTGPTGPGTIMVTVSHQGTDLPLGGYRASVDAGPARALDSLNLRATFAGLDPRAYSVRLEGLAPNCSVVGQNPMTARVASSQTTLVQFIVACVANVGTVRVTTVTTGGDPDPNGYVVMVDGVQRSTVGASAAITVADVRVGLHAISLSGVATNCRMFSAQPVNVNVTFQGTVDVGFTLECPTAGTLTVTVATTGVDLDLDGYAINVSAASVGFSERRSTTPNGTLTFTPIIPATDYIVLLQDMNANCHIAGPLGQTVEVVAGGTTSVRFDVACEAPQLLAMVRDNDIYVTSSAGVPVTRLTTDAQGNADPAWSAAGRIAFTTTRHSGDRELYVMNDDGTNAVRLTTSLGPDDAPSWSPDGRKIVFRSQRAIDSEIYTVNADGTGLTRLTNNTAEDLQPAWSSTGQIVFISGRDNALGEIYVMNEDGSNVVRLTHNDSAETGPAWSPDGSMIAFASGVECYYICWQDIFVMNADGSNVRRLATAWATYLSHTDPAWSPNGRSIAFTRQDCSYYGYYGYYCNAPELWLVDLERPQPSRITNNAANAAWKP